MIPDEFGAEERLGVGEVDFLGCGKTEGGACGEVDSGVVFDESGVETASEERSSRRASLCTTIKRQKRKLSIPEFPNILGGRKTHKTSALFPRTPSTKRTASWIATAGSSVSATSAVVVPFNVASSLKPKIVASWRRYLNLTPSLTESATWTSPPGVYFWKRMLRSAGVKGGTGTASRRVRRVERVATFLMSPFAALAEAEADGDGLAGMARAERA